MSENLTNIDYDEININIVHLYNYFNQNNYSYSDVSDNYNQYIATYLVNELKDSVNNNSVNYSVIENTLQEMIEINIEFATFFQSSDSEPYYIYKDTKTIKSIVIRINDASIDQYYLINIKYEEVATPTIDTNVETCAVTDSNNVIDSTISQSVNSSFFNNDIIFAKSLNSSSDIFEQLTKKNTWKLVTLVNDLDIVYSLNEACNIVIQITASINILSTAANSYSWGLFDCNNQSIAKSSIVVSNNCGASQSSFNSVKSTFFHLGNSSTGTYKYKWIHKDEKGINNIRIDNSYPVTIIAWKINNQVNDINISYLQHLSQKINELQSAYNNLSNRIDAL